MTTQSSQSNVWWMCGEAVKVLRPDLMPDVSTSKIRVAHRSAKLLPGSAILACRANLAVVFRDEGSIRALREGS